MGNFFDHMVIFKADRFFLGEPTFGTENVPYRIGLANRDVGCEAQFSVVNTDNNLIWKAERGFYTIEAVDSFGKVKVKKISNRIAPDLTGIPPAERLQIVAVHLKTPERRHYRVAYAPGGTTLNTKFFIYDYDHLSPDPEDGSPVGAWMPWSSRKKVGTAETPRAIEVMALVEDTGTGQDEVWFGDETGAVLAMDQDLIADQSEDGGVISDIAIESFILTKHYSHDLGNISKRWRELVLDGETIGSPLQLKWNMDFGQSKGGSSSVDLSTETSTDTWDSDPTGSGNGVWDTSKFAGSSDSLVVAGRKKLYRATGHRIQLRLSNTVATASWVLHGWTLYAIPRPTVRVRQV